MNKQQQELDEFYKQKKWPYWSELSILARLMEETGEFARIVNHLYGDKKKKQSEGEQNLEDELGDILFTLACFANSHDINLDNALMKSLEKVKGRDATRWDKKQ